MHDDSDKHERLHQEEIPRLICDHCTDRDEERYWHGSADAMRWRPGHDIIGGLR